jgi:aminomethyltransferase
MMMTTELLRTPLHDWHVAHGGRMVDFAGWSMPVQYKSIAEEHNATRNAIGVFDISHMGRLEFTGTDVAKFLDSIVTRRVVDLKPTQVRYGLVCSENGGILDDVLVYGGNSTTQPYSMVTNASNREKIVNWLNAKKPSSIAINDRTLSTGMIAVQGPNAIELLSEPLELNSIQLSDVRYYTYVCGYFKRYEVLVSRTGYTGEDGAEIVCDAPLVTEIWNLIIDRAKEIGGSAAGLGARDTLRLEAAMPLYGHELSKAINPIQAGLGFAANLDGRKFIGSDALQRFAADKSQPVRIGLHVEGKRVARQGSPVLQNNEVVGEVTSGTYSPTLDRPIAMAYVQPAASAIGTQLTTDIRGTQHPAVVVPLPFYQRTKKS